MNNSKLSRLVRLMGGLFVAAFVLSACNSNGGDGPVMSDEEKLKTFEKGRNAYSGGMNSGSASGATSGAAGATGR